MAVVSASGIVALYQAGLVGGSEVSRRIAFHRPITRITKPPSDPDALVSFTRSTFIPAYDSAHAVIEALSRQDERTIRWASRYTTLLHRLLLPARQIKERVEQRLSNPTGDTPLIAVLDDLYEQYVEIASWINIAGYDLPMDWDSSIVKQWIESNQRLDVALSGLLSGAAYHGSGLHTEFNKGRDSIAQAVKAAEQWRDKQVAERRLRQFAATSMFPAVDIALDLLRSVEAPMSRMDGVFPSYGILLTRAIIEPVKNARVAVENGLDGKDPTPFDALVGDLYEKYQWALTWIARGGHEAGFDWSVDRFADWLQRDAVLRGQLSSFIADPAFRQSNLAARVKQVGWGESVQKEIARRHAEANGA
ncbi:MAG: hypothetical protein Q8M79_00245 [Dehalococcoidia bacterium]|nr:hypothetical protein [Dehalococcoidia bacterium]